MPDSFDDLTKLLRDETEKWLDSAAPSAFSFDRLDQQLVNSSSVAKFEERVEGWTLDTVKQSYVNHVRRDAVTRVRRQLLTAGTKTFRAFFRLDLTQAALFGPGGLMKHPVIYVLGEDNLVPLKHLDIREGVRHELQVIKEHRADEDTVVDGLELSEWLLDNDPDLNGTVDKSMPALYARLLAEHGDA